LGNVASNMWQALGAGEAGGRSGGTGLAGGVAGVAVIGPRAFVLVGPSNKPTPATYLPPHFKSNPPFLS